MLGRRVLQESLGWTPKLSWGQCKEPASLEEGLSREKGVPAAGQSSPITFSFSRSSHTAIFADQTALLTVLGRSDMALLVASVACSWPACLDTVPASCPSHSCHRVPTSSLKPFKASQLEAPSLSEVLEHLFGCYWLYCLTWGDTALLGT